MRFGPSRTGYAILAAIVLGALLTAAVHQRAEKYFRDEAIRQGQAAIDLHVEVVRGWLGRYRALAPVYARDPEVVALLADPGDVAQLDIVNRKLSAWTTMSGASDTYLLDAAGTAIAASNWADEVSFVGKDYSYRPYYRQAMQGRLGRFFALGTASLKRGYYFSHPVRIRDRIAGAAVVKVGVDEIEQDLRTSTDEVFITDDSGVIVLAGNPDWRLKTLGPLSEDERSRIGADRQYDLDTLVPAPIDGITRQPAADGVEQVSARPDGSGADTQRFLHLTQPMAAEGWTMHLLADAAPARAQGLTVTILAASVLMAAGLGAAMLWQRRRRLIERLTEREHARALLERTVDERTAELRDTNLRLEGEIAERIVAEAELRRTQADLVQAGKLAALGQMSAALSHEFNQPLTAVRSYAENAIAFMERGSQDQAARNIARISTLTQRMAQLSRHLSSFARKPEADSRPVKLADVFDETLGLLHGRLERAGIEPAIHGLDGDTRVIGGSVRLQHVFMNLIGNAIDALRGQRDAVIEVGVATTGETVTVTVADNGPGISEANLTRIFDPFFTTKTVGKGLGLGLSISYNIIRDFGGTIRAGNRPGGGAIFTVTLRRADPAAAEAAE
ncbi:MAG TPA: ATP-binding protein [Thermohalobaculum sp.]|nr:ATP-binding protein [Thermohalobaculum sp.]